MNGIKKTGPGILVCFALAVPAWLLGKRFPLIGGAVLAILGGMLLTMVWTNKGRAEAGIRFTSKYVLQAAVVLLGFGLNLGVILKTGRQSLPIIVCTIATALLLAWGLQRALRISGNIATLVGVGSSICGGSAIAATAPVIDISVIFFFNVLAAIFFPILGRVLGFDTGSGTAFGVFAGTAINDTSSVTAAASTWDSMWKLGTDTLDTAVTVKLTRTLAIIPITLALSVYRAKQAAKAGGEQNGFQLRRAFPMFILYFILAALITTVALQAGVSSAAFRPLKELSKFCIVMAMAAIGLNSNVVKLIRSGGKPLLLGAVCWAGITCVSLLMQQFMGLR